jgi:hypothetical protein
MLDTQLGSSSLGLEKEPNVFSMPIEACMAYTGTVLVPRRAGFSMHVNISELVVPHGIDSRLCVWFLGLMCSPCQGPV